MKHVLIFGISGFVGTYLAEEFHRAGYAVSGCDVVCMQAMPDYVTFAQCDLMDAVRIAALCGEVGPTHIVNLAAISSVSLSWKIPQTTVATNVIGSLNILEAARQCQIVPRILFIGSSEEYAGSDQPIREDFPLDAGNPYGLSKAMQERFAGIYQKQYGMHIYRVRAFNHTGVGQQPTFVIPSWCAQIAEIVKSGEPGVLRVGNLDVIRDFSHVKDIARAYRMVVESDDDKTVYNVGSGVAYRLKEILGYILSKANQPVTVQIEPSYLRQDDFTAIRCDHSRITEKLGWIPELTVFHAIDEILLRLLR